MCAASGFAPIARADATILILGSLPGQRSLQESEYYAHPRNAFWVIMRELFSVEGEYQQRCEQLRNNNIAVWDVLERSVRPGSLDADIRKETAKANDFEAFFSEHPGIRLVCFNGQQAARLFTAMVKLDPAGPALRFETMPSTSPAYASMSLADKVAAWQEIFF